MVNEQMLIEQLKQGTEEAYRCLFCEHYAVLCHAARQLVADDFTAETLVGDVIFHLWEIRKSLDIQVSLRSYLLRAVRNRCLDHLSSLHERKNINFSALDNDSLLLGNYSYTDDHPLGQLLEQEMEHVINQAICALPDECRRVFSKSRFEEKKYEEIADELGISVNTVKYHIKHALSLLHDKLGKYLSALVLLITHL